MKNFNLILLLSIIIVLAANVCYGKDLIKDKSNLNWIPTSQNSILEKANNGCSNSSYSYPQLLQNPFVSGYGNFIQGSTGGSYNAVEQQKQQTDYAKQKFDTDDE